MTLEQLVSALHARRTGKGKYLALCPSHADRRPSLTIREGKKGILLKCMSQNCKIQDIVDALGVRLSDLFYDAGIHDPKELRKLEVLRKQQEAERQREKYRIRTLMAQYRFWERRVQSLGRQLAEHDSPQAARLFHEALDRFRRLDAEVKPILDPKGSYLS